MAPKFPGFDLPYENYSKLPHMFIWALPDFSSVSELKVVLYILRHTWGFQNDEQRMSLDEICNGRKYADGTRMDNGTGLTEPSARDGLERAYVDGFISITVDDRDSGRVKKFYSIRYLDGVKSLPPGRKEFTLWLKEVYPRTYKDIEERKQQKESTANADAAKGTEDSLALSAKPLAVKKDNSAAAPRRQSAYKLTAKDIEVLQFVKLNTEGVALSVLGLNVQFDPAVVDYLLYADYLGVEYGDTDNTYWLTESGAKALAKASPKPKKERAQNPLYNALRDDWFNGGEGFNLHNSIKELKKFEDLQPEYIKPFAAWYDASTKGMTRCGWSKIATHYGVWLKAGKPGLNGTSANGTHQHAPDCPGGCEGTGWIETLDSARKCTGKAE